MAAVAILILGAGQAAIPSILTNDPATVLDTSGALLYLSLPLLAMLASVSTAWLEKPWTSDQIGPVNRAAASFAQVSYMLVWLLLAPVASALFAFARAGELRGDPVTILVVILIPGLWLCLAGLMGWVSARAAHKWAAPVVAGLATAVLVVVARPSMYPLGHSATMAGTRPVVESWAVPAGLMAAVVLVVGISSVLGDRPNVKMQVASSVAGLAVLVMAAGYVPAQTFDRVNSNSRSCTGGPIVVCSDNAHLRWRDATASMAADLHLTARDLGLTLPVRRIEIQAGDTAAENTLPRGAVQVALDPRSAPEGMPADQLSSLLVGAPCVRSSDPTDEIPQIVAATATWVAGARAKDPTILAQEWPSFAERSPVERRQLAQKALKEVQCGGRFG